MTSSELEQCAPADRMNLAQGRLLREYNQDDLLVVGQPDTQQQQQVWTAWKHVADVPTSLQLFPDPGNDQQLILSFRDWGVAGVFVARPLNPSAVGNRRRDPARAPTRAPGNPWGYRKAARESGPLRRGINGGGSTS